VTVFVGDINFHYPIAIGSLIEVNSKIIHTGSSSMHISIDLFSSDPRQGKREKAIHCIMVFVGVDENGKPVKVPAWTPEIDEDLTLQSYAKRMIEMRKTNQQYSVSQKNEN
jgi:acyl-CoA hydrolase